MADGDVHTVRFRGGWANRLEAAATVLSTHVTVDDAIEHGRETAINAEVTHLIHDTDGRIRQLTSYRPANPPTRVTAA
jgi:hypothetical protein